MKKQTLCILISFVIFEAIAATDSNEYVEDSINRYRRQVPGMGGESCLQIYSVPKRSVVCEPSQEVRNEIVEIKKTLETQKESMSELVAKVESLDPDKPRELPEDVLARLDTIDEVKRTQAGHTEYLKRLETELQHLLERMQRIESADRQELGRLIELQTRLIQVTLHQSNVSLHDEYIDKLAESTGDLTNKLQQLELDLSKNIYQSETRLENEAKRSNENSRAKVDELEKMLKEQLLGIERSLEAETGERRQYQNRTEDNQKEVSKLLSALTSLREHQAETAASEARMREDLDQLQERLVEAVQSKARLSDKADHLAQRLEQLVANQDDLEEQLRSCSNRSSTLQAEIRAVQEQVKQREHLLPRTLRVSDCADALRYFQPASGVYSINPSNVAQPFDVYCDMNATDGWTVIHRRQDGATDFFRGWHDYKQGFGDVNGEHWFGLSKLFALTSRKKYQLRIDLQDFDGKWWYAEYDNFHIDDEDNSYKLHVSGYHGDAGDSLKYHNGMGFSTNDRSNDENDGICATWCHGAWWYRDCFHSNLNGRYYNSGPYMTKSGWGDGLVWRHIKGTNFYSLKAVVMKIKPSTAL